MRVLSDFGKVEYDVLLDYVNETTVPPDHPLAPVYGAIGKVFQKEIARRRSKYNEHRPATQVDLPIEGLEPEQILNIQAMVTEITKKLWPLGLFHGARFFQAVGLACHDLIKEKIEQQATLH